MPFVVDASIAVAWALKETHAKASVALTRVRTQGGVVPSLWWFEVRNGLLIGERRGRLTQHDTAFFLRRVSRLAFTVDQAPDETGVLTLARRHRFTMPPISTSHCANPCRSPRSIKSSQPLRGLKE